MSTTIITRKKSKPVMVTPEKRPSSYEKKVHQTKIIATLSLALIQ